MFTFHLQKIMETITSILATSCVRAEHSKYFTAWIFSLISKPCSYVIDGSSSLTSSLKSSWVPTNIIGIFGQKCLTSGCHCVDTIESTVQNVSLCLLTFAMTLSNESRLTNEKHIKSTSYVYEEKNFNSYWTYYFHHSLYQGRREVVVFDNLPDLQVWIQRD